MPKHSTFRKLLAPALLLTLMAGMFTFDGRGVAWFWAHQPGVALALVAGAAVTWAMAIAAYRRSRVD